MHSYIILGNLKTESDNKKSEIVQQFNVPVYRQTILSDATDIKTIRIALRSLHQSASPSEFQALIISSIKKLTETSQQTLLKTIEEPPKNTICIIQGTFSDFILPTLISRSKIIRIASSTSIESEDKIATYWQPVLTNKSLTNALLCATNISSRYKEKDDLLNWLDMQILFFRSLMQKRAGITHKGKLSSAQIKKIVSYFLSAKRYISYNCNQKLVVDNLFLALHN